MGAASHRLTEGMRLMARNAVHEMIRVVTLSLIIERCIARSDTALKP